MKDKILFLYSEVMPYTIGVLEALTNQYDIEVHVVRWDKKTLTPYAPPQNKKIFFYKRSELNNQDLISLINKISPSLCYVSGWMDMGYLKVALQLRKKGIPVVAGIDNQWNGSLKQKLGTLLSPVRVKPYFSHVMVPGLLQYEFARRLGYSNENIITNLYSANVGLFQKAHFERTNWKKRILFVGRFNEVKGIELLYEAFIELSNQFPEWKLLLIGNGPLKEKFKETNAITIKDFSSSEKLVIEAKDSSIFCLPSRKEPWGVVIHEFASAGMALLTSSACGANTEFLRHGYNGYIFKTNSKESLKNYLQKLMNASDNSIAEMGNRSHQLAQHVTPEMWATSFMSVLDQQ